MHALYLLLAFVVTSGLGDFVADTQVVVELSLRCVGACERLDAAGALDLAINAYDEGKA